MHRSVRIFGLAACVALLAACGDDEGEGPGQGDGADAGDGAAAAAPRFALVRGTDTLLVEEYRVEGSRVSGTMSDPTGSAVLYETTYSTDGERIMRITLQPADPAAGPPIVSTFTLRGDSAWLETTRGDSTVRNGDALTAGAQPYMAPSVGMMALVAQTARTIVGDSGQIPLLAASIRQDPVLVSPLIRWRADTAWVIGDQMNQFRLVFANGELVSAENPPQQLRFIKLGAAAAPAAPAQQP